MGLTDWIKEKTPNHGLRKWMDNAEQWDINDEMGTIEERLVVRDLEDYVSNYVPHEDALAIATDTGAVYRADGDQWHKIQSTGAAPQLESVNADKVSSGTLSYDYILRTDGSTIDAIPQRTGLTKITGASDVGPLLETLIVDELPPQGSRKEAAGSIFAKRGQYPGKLDNVPNGAAPPLPTSCHIYGEGANHTNSDITDNLFPETEPLTEFRTDSVGFVQPDVDSDLTSFPMLANLKLSGPGETVSDSVGLDGGSNSNRWDWLIVRDCVIMDFETPVDFSNSHDTRVLESHLLRFSSVVSGTDKHWWKNCGFWSEVVGSTIELAGDFNNGHTRFVDNVVTNTADSGAGQVEVHGKGAHIRGCSFQNANSDSGNAISVLDTADNPVVISENMFRSSTYDATIYYAASSPGGVVAWNQDYATAGNSIVIRNDDATLSGNHFPNGIDAGASRIRFDGTIVQSSAPSSSNYTSGDAGTTIIDTSASPPDEYVIGTDGSLHGPL